jgi:hypothetical protein
MNENDLRRAMDGAEFQEDVREDADDRRHARFRTGWNDAIEGKTYRPQAPHRLTWQNAGNRVGALFGECSDEEIGRAVVGLVDARKFPPKEGR